MTDLDKLIQLASADTISDELLAAYIDGNTTEEENAFIESSSPMEDLNDISEIITDTQSFEDKLHFYDGDYGFWELGIPPVLDINDESMLNTPEELMKSEFYTYGEDAENIYDPIFIQQPDDHSCALRCQQIILRDFGIDIPFEKLEKLALDNGVYTPDGTYRYDIGKVLELAGVGMHQVNKTSIDALIEELSQGHRVIVSVDADELWYNSSMTDQLKNWLNDVIGFQGGNHALIVAGIEVNPVNIRDIKVVLTDPGTGHLRIEYPANQFMNAWKDSNYFMAATDEAAPYQYDYETGMEVPSNFSKQQFVNQFVEENSYQLSPDKVNIPIGYEPAFKGHVDLFAAEDYSSEVVDRTNERDIISQQDIDSHHYTDEVPGSSTAFIDECDTDFSNINIDHEDTTESIITDNYDSLEDEMYNDV